MVKITASDFRGLYAIIPTPATIDASASQAEATVDLTETGRLIEALLHDGVDALIALGTTGECATLMQAEYETFVDAVLQTTNGRTSTIIGTTALGTHEAIRRAKFAAARGAHAMLLGLPMWQPCTMDMALRHYAAVAEACPNLPIMVYANSRAFRFDYTDPGFWSRIRAAAPSVVAAKFSRAKALLPCLEASEGAVHFLPHDDAVHAFYELSPQTTTACWATSASMGPEPSRALIDAILAADAPRAKTIAADIAWANQPTKTLVDNPELFASYNIQMEKARINASGYCNAGPNRPPYDVFPDELRSQAEEVGKRWQTLRPKYARTALR
jgi:trans-o-hydroxybenzylidenepyruvate hydratase-aldolase